MSITKEQISVLVQDLVGGGDQPVGSKYHPDNIAKVTELAVNQLITLDYFRSRNEGTYNINGDFITAFPNASFPDDITVELDENRNEYYSVLPSKYASLPDDRGIRHVSEIQNQDEEFIKTPSGASSIYKNLEAGNAGGRSSYYVEAGRIYYKNIKIGLEKVLIKLIRAVEDIEPDEALPIPSSMELTLLEKVAEVMEISKEALQDKINDNNTK